MSAVLTRNQVVFLGGGGGWCLLMFFSYKIRCKGEGPFSEKSCIILQQHESESKAAGGGRTGGGGVGLSSAAGVILGLGSVKQVQYKISHGSVCHPYWADIALILTDI